MRTRLTVQFESDGGKEFYHKPFFLIDMPARLCVGDLIEIASLLPDDHSLTKSEYEFINFNVWDIESISWEKDSIGIFQSAFCDEQ